MSFFNKEGTSKPVGEKKRGKRSKNAAAVSAETEATQPLPSREAEPHGKPEPDEVTTQPLPVIARTGGTDPLPPLDTIEMNGVNKRIIPQRLVCRQLEVAYASDVGMLRDNNEDSVAVFLGMIPRTEHSQELQFGFFAVADGMGGHEHGEVASNLAVRVTLKGVLSEIYMRSIEGRSVGNTGETPGEVLSRIIENANQSIVREGANNRGGMGTTLTCMVLVGSSAYIGHVGDSRLYGLERGSRQLVQLTKDHSLVARLVEAGALTEAEAAESPQRSVLYKSLGQRLETPADTDFVRASDYSHLMMCSDGLWDMLPDKTIGYLMTKHEDPATICYELVKAANAAGGEDNVSVVVIRL